MNIDITSVSAVQSLISSNSSIIMSNLSSSGYSLRQGPIYLGDSGVPASMSQYDYWITVSLDRVETEVGWALPINQFSGRKIDVFGDIRVFLSSKTLQFPDPFISESLRSKALWIIGSTVRWDICSSVIDIPLNSSEFSNGGDSLLQFHVYSCEYDTIGRGSGGEVQLSEARLRWRGFVQG